MLKRVLCVGTVMAVCASTAMATAWITNIDEAISGDTYNTTTYAKTPYLVGSMSSDGRYVGITRPHLHTNGTWYDAAAVFDTTTNTYGTFRLNSGHGATRGVANVNGVPLAIVAEGNNNAATWKQDVLGGAPLSGYMDGGAVAVPGGRNAMAVDAQGNGWMVGGTIGGNQARAWRVTGGAVNSSAAYQAQVYPGNNILNSVSHTGMAVGNWNDGSDRAYLANVGASTNRALNFGQISSQNRSQGNAMSNNGLWAGGFVYVDDANSLNGWRLEINPNFPTAAPDPMFSDGIYTRLLPVGYDPLVAQQSNVFAMADDGTAAGFSYDPIAGYTATLWAAGSDQGVEVWDILDGLGVDLSEWASLERVISISDDGMTIAGRGVLASDGSYSAFVAMIPEPATLSFLALGGLALLRRRR